MLKAVVRYELLWNLRKRRVHAAFIIVFALSTLFLFLPPLLTGNIEPNPHFAMSESAAPAGSFGGLFHFIFALVLFMSSISGEFESGSILPLLSKPISRKTIFLGKLLAAFVILVSMYTVLNVYLLAGGWALYGPQKNLHLIPLGLAGTLISTLVYGSIILTIGSMTKSSTMAGFGGLSIWLGMAIASGIIAATLGPINILHYLPGGGAIGYMEVANSPLDSEFAGPGPRSSFPGLPTSSGTDNVGGNLLRYALHGNEEVRFVKLEFLRGEFAVKVLAMEAMSQVLLRSLGVSFAYIALLLLTAFYSFRRTEALESA